MLTCFSKTELELMVGKDEKVLWAGRPDKLCFILEGIFNPMLPFALIWFYLIVCFYLCLPVMLVQVRKQYYQFYLYYFT